MPAQLYRPFEDLLNRGISASGEATRLSQTLAGRRLCIELRGLPLSLQITATEQGIALSDQADSPADCTLSGLP
ncbi:MAG: SCP2 sterol-binding domain-containing protein, partial [Gammaproteobacteria bacterium]